MKRVTDSGLFSSALPLLKATYIEIIVPQLIEQFNYTKLHEVPKVEKVIVNCGLGDAAQHERGLGAAMNDLSIITGQKPFVTRVARPVAHSKIREGHPVAIFCTLRGSEFPDHLLGEISPNVEFMILLFRFFVEVEAMQVVMINS